MLAELLWVAPILIYLGIAAGIAALLPPEDDDDRAHGGGW